MNDNLSSINDGHTNGLNPQGDFSSADGILIRDCKNALLLYGIDFNVSKLKTKNITSYNFYLLPLNGISNILNFTDSELDFSSHYILTTNYGDMTCNNISTFKINITDGDGGTAKLYDQFDNLVFSETLSGVLTKQVTFEKLYAETNYALVEDTLTTYETFKLIVSKTGYADLEIPGITVTAGDITEIFGEMEYPDFVVSSLSFTNCTTEVSNDGTIKIGRAHV